MQLCTNFLSFWLPLVMHYGSECNQSGIIPNPIMMCAVADKVYAHFLGTTTGTSQMAALWQWMKSKEQKSQFHFGTCS